MSRLWPAVEPVLTALRPRVIVAIGIGDAEDRSRLSEFARDHDARVEAIEGAENGERAVQALPQVAADANAILLEAGGLEDRLKSLLSLLDALTPAAPGGFPVCLVHGDSPDVVEAALRDFVGVTSRDLATAAVPGCDGLQMLCERTLLDPFLKWAEVAEMPAEAAGRVRELERRLTVQEGEIALLRGLLGQREEYLGALETTVTEQASLLHATWSSRYWRLTAPLRGLVGAYRTARRRLGARGRRVRSVPVPLASLEFGVARSDEAEVPRSLWARAPEIGLRTPWRLEQHVPARVVYPLSAPAGSVLATEAIVRSRAWAPAQASVRAHIRVLSPDGEQVAGASVELDPQQRGGRKRSHAFNVSLGQGGDCLVVLEVEAVESATARAVLSWQEPIVSVPLAQPVAVEAGTGARSRHHAAEPAISVVLPVHDPPPRFLERAIESVLGQSYPRWQLCIADDGSQDPEVISLLQDYAGRDERISLVRREQGGGISAGSNAALSLATGEFVALLDHDDELEPEALRAVASYLVAHPETDIVYTDEDRMLADGSRFGAILKPDWSPDLLRSGMYSCHLGVYRRRLVEEVGGFRSEFDGSQDFDLMLRLVERTDRVGHVPRVLYHWRASDASVAINPMAKPYAYEAGRRAIQAHLDRTGVDGTAYRTDLPGLYEIHHRVDPEAPVSIVVAHDDPAPDALTALERCAREIARRTAHPGWELVCVAPPERAAEARQALECADPDRVRVVEAPESEGHAAMLSRGGREATGQHLLLLDAPCVPLEEDWLGALLGFAAQEGIGAAGAKVLRPDGVVEHAGVVLGEGLPLPAYRGVPGGYMGYLGTLRVSSNYLAVAGALMTPRALFCDLGGLRPLPSLLAEVDYCLRAAQRGLRSVLVPRAAVETAVPPRFRSQPLAALAAFKARWQPAFPQDPYHHPDFWQQRVGFPAPWVAPRIVGEPFPQIPPAPAPVAASD